MTDTTQDAPRANTSSKLENDTDSPGGSKPARSLAPLRSLLPLLRPHRGLIAAWLAALALSSSATLALPVAVRYVIDRGFGASDVGTINTWFEILLGVALVLALATAARFFFVSLLGERVAADLRRRVYDNLLRLDMPFFEQTRGGELLSRLSADAELLRSVVGSTMSVALRSVITFVGSMVALVITSPRLAGFAAIGIPLTVLPIVLFGRMVQSRSRESQDRVADANARAGETLSAMHTVQSYAREDYESGRFSDAIATSLTAAKRRIRSQSMLTGVVILLVFGAVTSVLWLGAHDVISGDMQPGLLTQFVFFAMLGAGSIGALTEVWSEIQRAAGAMQRIGELLAETPAITASDSPETLATPLRGQLGFDAVRFHYPSRPDAPALEGFELQVSPGETVALVGPSGAGKSTVLQLLLRFYDPDSGVIRLDGHDIRALDPRELRDHVALVPQSPVIFGASARDNIRYGRLDASDAEVEEAARLAEADSFIRALPDGYESYLGEQGTRLSGGQRQRIAIARALLKDAPVLLLDEATSALDAQSERSIQQALERLMQGRTTLVIAHRLATVKKADRIVVLDHGRIVAQGTHDRLVAEGGLYAELARLQFSDAPD